MNRADLPRVTDLARELVERLEKAGDTAWQTTDAWQRGAGTASYDPESGGNRWYEDDEGNVWPVPSDPTGDRALTPEEVDDAHRRYRRRLEAVERAILLVLEDIDRATPRTPNRIADADRMAAQIGAEGWCSSCYRIGKFVDQAMHQNGTVRYQARCRWCHDFEAEYKRLPPLTLLRKRHSGRSVTMADISRALGFQAKAS